MTREPFILPVELSPDFTAQLQVPRDLTLPEAEKLSRVLLALGGGEVKMDPQYASRRAALKTKDNREKERG